MGEEVTGLLSLKETHKQFVQINNLCISASLQNLQQEPTLTVKQTSDKSVTNFVYVKLSSLLSNTQEICSTL